ncbi:cysteine desulfurase family protein [Vagococcus elongatus]|uniref:cysteine desulfurase n=1 Tax=Vagococcus elongatus TaxID=180344 RepID=A0A430AML9_9ENTE|nr:cysteine desulfurase family protein [Vagococcus elongatus]RSU09372.1 cysteine desulfurase NifS [Vagococcus elongatus]
MKSIYLDHAATTPLAPEVIEEMYTVMKDTFGNPSSLHRFGQSAQGVLENSREIIAKSIGAESNEIIFTGSGSESDNLAILKTAENYAHLGKHLITSQVEHSAVLKTFKYLEKKGFEVTYLPVTSSGELSVADVANALREDTILVSLMHTNNETGAIFPIRDIGELLKDHQALFHTDAVQAYGLQEIDVHDWQVDLLSAGAHKINGPKGLGFLYVQKGMIISPLIHGGEQENKKRAGTENIPAIAGFAKAVSLLTAQKKKNNFDSYQLYRNIILDTLSKNHLDFSVNGQTVDQSPHILNLSFSGVSSEMLLTNLDLRGFAVSAGSACTAGTIDPSHVLVAMYGADSSIINTSIRISFGIGLTEEDIQAFANTLVELVSRLSG